jgi:hypothetical protein
MMGGIIDRTTSWATPGALPTEVDPHLIDHLIVQCDQLAGSDKVFTVASQMHGARLSIKQRHPNCVSRRLICWLTALWVLCTSRAADVIRLVSETLTKVRKREISISRTSATVVASLMGLRSIINYRNTRDPHRLIFEPGTELSW